jgi:hypothetical protein
MPVTYQYLTDRTFAPSSAITSNALIHIVDPNDISQNPDGSSFKVELNQLSSIFGSSGDTFVTGGTYSAGTATFTNNTGGTFNVSGFYTGETVTITGATNLGTGLTIFDSVLNQTIQLNTITGDSLNKITTTLNSNTIELGIDEENLYLWNLVVQGNKLLEGNVSYISGLTFNVSPLEYIIDGTLYNISTNTIVTLNSGDSIFDRIDVIYADISGNTGVLQGTPSTNPEKPLVDGNQQIEVTFVSVPANSLTPLISQSLIYDENVGPPSEWSFGRGGTQFLRISGNSTDTAYSGVTSIKVSGVTGSDSTFFRLTGASQIDTTNFSSIQFAIKNLSVNANTNRIRLRFLTTGGTQNGNFVYIDANNTTNYVQYSSTNTATWQLLSIPLWRFYLTNTNIQVLEVSFRTTGANQARYYFDWFTLLQGAFTTPPSNNWITIKGDTSTTITAPSPNSTLTISGGTNINSFISGTSAVVLNLDNNINLNGVTATTISATTYQNLPGSTSANCITELFVGKIRPCTTIFQVVGDTVLSGKTPTALKVVSSGSSTSEPILDVSGSTGDLFSVKDSLTGNLFSVNNISGIPIMEIYDNNKMKLGSFSSPASYTTVKFLPTTGLTDVFSIDISGNTGAWFDYTVVNAITPSARAGQIMAIFSANTVNYVESTTSSIGVTSAITLSLSANSTNCILQTSATTLGWEVKTIIRSI